MFFLQPSLLIGLLGLSIPVAIHLIARRKRHKIVFGSLRFLRESQRRVGRAFNLRQLLLLILRMLILAALILAFARPMTSGGWLASWLGAEGRQAILLMDTSYSMGALSGNEPLIRRAQNAALTIVDGLGSGSKTAVIAFDRDARTLTPGWTTDRAETRQIIQSLRVSPKETNLSSALSLLPGLLKTAGSGTREIFLLTDSQKTAWSHVDRMSFDESNLRFLVVDCGETIVPNAAIDSLQLSIVKTLKKAPARIRATIVNYGESELTPLCSLFVNGKKTSEQRLYIPAGGRTDTRFDLIPDQAEFLTGYLALSSDGLGTDNRRYFCSRLFKQIPVTVVDPNTESDPPDSHYLLRALAPPGADISALQPTIVPQLSLERLREGGFVIFMDAAQIPPEKWLESWIRRGGHAIVFFNETPKENVPDDSLLSGIRFAADTRIGNEYSRMTQAAGIDEAVSALLKAAQFYQTASLTPDASDPAVSVMARFNDGRPAVLRKALDAGTLLCAAIPAGTQWTDFPLQVSYLPFIHELLSLALDESAPSLSPGQPLWFISGAEQAELTAPDGKTTPFVAKEQPIPPAAESPGIYRASVNRNGTQRNLAAAVNVVSIESNPEKLTLDELKTLIPNAQSISADGVLKSPENRIGVSDWTDAVLILALALIAAEFFLAGRFAVPAVRREGKRKEGSWKP